MKKSMLWVVLLVATGASAQETQYARQDKALLFSLQSLDLRSYRGGLGGKYFVSPKRAWSLGVKVNASSQAVTADNGDERTITDLRLSLIPGYDVYFAGRERFSPFVGARVILSYERNSRQNNGQAPDDAFSSTTSGFYLAFAPVLGAEYFLTPNISLAGHASIRIAYSKSDSAASDSSTFLFFTNVSRLTLAVYF